MPESDFLGLIQSAIIEVLTRNGGSMGVFEVLRAVESKYEWVSMLYLSQAVEQQARVGAVGQSMACS